MTRLAGARCSNSDTQTASGVNGADSAQTSWDPLCSWLTQPRCWGQVGDGAAESFVPTSCVFLGSSAVHNHLMHKWKQLDSGEALRTGLGRGRVRDDSDLPLVVLGSATDYLNFIHYLASSPCQCKAYQSTFLCCIFIY